MIGAELALDAVLAGALPVLAYRAVVADGLAKAVVLFVAFGLLCAIAWARLRAPDIALVEAAVGTGLTGALLMGALGFERSLEEARGARAGGAAPGARALFAGAVALVAALLLSTLAALPLPAPGLGDAVRARVEASGVSHAVTAVLLVFRGYDTLLETAVLLVAALATEAQRRAARARADARAERYGPLLPALVRTLTPGVVTVAGFLLAIGSHAPGGAFQAGALLAGLAVLLMVAGVMPSPSMATPGVRALLVVGPLSFVLAAALPILFGRAMLVYPSPGAGAAILALETTLMLSIATALGLFFPAVRRSPSRDGLGWRA